MLLLSCSEQEKEPLKYKYGITASVKSCEGCEVKLKADLSRHFEVLDSTVVRDGSFSFAGELADSGFYEVVLRHPKRFISVNIFLPADSIQLTVDAENKLRTKFYGRESLGSSLKYAFVNSTSPVQRETEKYLLMRDSLWDKFFQDREKVLSKFRETYGSADTALAEQWADSVKNFELRAANYWSYAADLFIQQGAGPEATIFAMLDNRNDRIATERFRGYFKSLPAAYQSRRDGRYLDNALRENEERNRNNQRFVGSRIRNLDFSGSTPQGEEVDESTIFRKNKLTLVEFWASWCGPCRMEMPKYAELLELYRGNGFDIIAVSLDNSRDRWVRAIEQDGLEVHHISELKGASGEDARRFFIKGIPANMLVDTNGKIVAVDVSQVDLKNLLKENL